MIKKLLSVFVMLMIAAISLLPTSAKVSAEQAAAEQYRQMFRSGNFYVECQIVLPREKASKKTPHRSGITTYAGKNGNRMQRTIREHGHTYYLPVSFYRYDFKSNGEQDIIKRASDMISSDVFYQNKKYYRINFIGRTAKVLTEDEINSPNLNIDEGWQYIKRDLSLPDELAIFYWDDKFHENPFNLIPYYNGNSTREIDKKVYDCDQYLIDIKSLAGKNVAQEAYNMLYENGQLMMIQRYLIYDGKEYFIHTLKIIKITSEVPEDTFVIGKKIKVYAADVGKMGDLLEQPELVEEIGGKKK
ncbi:MAG: hypothetical protein IJ563_05885 [Selenomonadaceae bacterium]|nr:hypothetical protein [Selenomonadaceae bacterium]MBR1859565.1 hypothetical protein [Selenomonadaceae bacterium]